MTDRRSEDIAPGLSGYEYTQAGAKLPDN